MTGSVSHWLHTRPFLKCLYGVCAWTVSGFESAKGWTVMYSSELELRLLPRCRRSGRLSRVEYARGFSYPSRRLLRDVSRGVRGTLGGFWVNPHLYRNRQGQLRRAGEGERLHLRWVTTRAISYWHRGRQECVRFGV